MPRSTLETKAPPVMRKVRELLDTGRPEEALLLLLRHGNGSPDAINARGVCLMRLGRPKESISLLRPLVFLKDSFCADPDARPQFITNFATALLLDGNMSGAREALKLLGPTQTPASQRLTGAIAHWRRGLGLLARLGLCLGLAPDRPMELDFPPGDL